MLSDSSPLQTINRSKESSECSGLGWGFRSDGTVDSQKKRTLPPSFPQSVPRPEGDWRIANAGCLGTSYDVTWWAKLPKENVRPEDRTIRPYETYKNALTQNGWTITRESPSSRFYTGAINASNGDLRLYITIYTLQKVDVEFQDPNGEILPGANFKISVNVSKAR